MTRGVAFVMIAYSLSMVFMGGAEMVHDLLHYLAEHHHSPLHHHSHSKSHSVHDHEPEHVHHAHEVAGSEHPSAAEESSHVPVAINFFLFLQIRPRFYFGDDQYLALCRDNGAGYRADYLTPPTPPPEETTRHPH